MAALRGVQMLGAKIDDSPTTLKAVTAAIIENGHMHRSDTLAWFGGHDLQQLKRTAAPAEPHVETAQFPRAYVSGVVPSDKLSDNAEKTPYEAAVMDGLPDLFARHEGAAKDAAKETAKTAAKTRAAAAKAVAGDEVAQGGPEAGVQIRRQGPAIQQAISQLSAHRARRMAWAAKSAVEPVLDTPRGRYVHVRDARRDFGLQHPVRRAPAKQELCQVQPRRPAGQDCGQ